LLLTLVFVIVFVLVEIFVGVVGTFITGGGNFFIAQGITKVSHIFMVVLQVKRF